MLIEDIARAQACRNRIALVRSGRAEALGTHHDLIRGNNYYGKIAELKLIASTALGAFRRQKQFPLNGLVRVALGTAFDFYTHSIMTAN